MEKIANISQFESLQNSYQPRVGVANWGNGAEKRWREWAWKNPELLAYAQRLARISSQGRGLGELDEAPTEIRANDPYVSSKSYYTKNPDYRGYRDVLYNRDMLNRKFRGDKRKVQEYYANMAKQNDRINGNVWPAMIRRLHANSLLTARELAYLGQHLQEVTSVIPWIRNTIKYTGQFRGTKFDMNDLQPRRWNE